MDDAPPTNGHERLTLLARMTSLFSSGLDRHATLQGVVDVFVPDFADWASVDVMEGSALRRVATRSIEISGFDAVMQELRTTPRPVGELRALVGGGHRPPIVVNASTIAELPWEPRGPEHITLLEAHLPISVVVAPLRARGDVVGSLQLAAVKGRRTFTSADALLVEDIAQRAAFAVHTAQLVAELQRELDLRREATERLEVSEARYRRMFDASPFPLFVYDAETLRFLAVNAATVGQYGYSREEFLALTIRDIRPAEDIPLLDNALKDRPHDIKFAGVFRHQRRDGSIFIVEIRSHAVEFDGRPARVVQAQDVTDRVRAYDALRVSEERHRLVARVTKEAIWEWQPQSNALEWNPAFAELFRYADDQVGSTLAWYNERIHPDDRDATATELTDAIAEGRTLCSRRFRFLRGDGSVAYVDDRAIITYAGGVAERVIGSMADVTFQNQLSEQLAIAQRMEAIGRLAGGVSHDFNNLLTAIRGFASFALDEQLPNSRARDDIEQILLAADRAAALTRQLLAFSRRQVLQPQLVNVNEIVASLQKMLTRVLGEDVELETFLAPDVRLVLVDPGQFEQVMMNLVVNARDAMPDGGVLTIKTSNVDLDAAYAESHVGATTGAHVAIAITDTGVGMDARTMARIFEPFFSTKERDKGTGLGLATTYGIVKQSGGHIWVYSEPGKGSTFKVYLPCAAEGTTADSVHALEPATTAGGTETILVVEDDERVRRVTTGALRRQGYEVLEARSAEAALNLFRDNAARIALVVTDVVLPRMNGPQLIRALSELHAGVRALYVSGYTENAILRQSEHEPGIELLEKPFAPDALVRRVRLILDRRPPGA